MYYVGTLSNYHKEFHSKDETKILTYIINEIAHFSRFLLIEFINLCKLLNSVNLEHRHLPLFLKT